MPVGFARSLLGGSSAENVLTISWSNFSRDSNEQPVGTPTVTDPGGWVISTNSGMVELINGTYRIDYASQTNNRTCIREFMIRLGFGYRDYSNNNFYRNTNYSDINSTGSAPFTMSGRSFDLASRTCILNDSGTVSTGTLGRNAYSGFRLGILHLGTVFGDAANVTGSMSINVYKL
jgi:hypothetical protein